jgi:hypothetical protein
MMVHVWVFQVVAAPLATRPPYELVVTPAPLSATMAVIRSAPDCELFDRT